MSRSRYRKAAHTVREMLKKYELAGDRLTGLVPISISTRAIKTAEYLTDKHMGQPDMVATGLLYNYYMVTETQQDEGASCSILSSAALDTLGFPLQVTMPINQRYAGMRYQYTMELRNPGVYSAPAEFDPFTREQMTWFRSSHWFHDTISLCDAVTAVDDNTIASKPTTKSMSYYETLLIHLLFNNS